jgi:Ser/Thr protein kinase RdoA (MazF antagonist)
MTGDAPLSAPAPNLGFDEIRALAKRLYGLDCLPSPLTSERDQNLLLQADDGHRYLLKITNPSEPRAVIALQTEALDHIASVAPDTRVPRIIPTVAGASCAQVELPDGRTGLVRLLTYLHGRPAWKAERSAGQRRSFGRSLAQLDLALGGFTHGAATHQLLWNVSGAHRLAHMASDIAPGRRPLIDHFMARFHEIVLPRLPHLRAQVIHNDFNLYNVLVDEEDETQVSGIIDFGDIMHAPLVGEVATGAAYQMTGEADPLSAAGEFVAAYHEVLPLSPEEQELVPDLIATRHLITVLITEWRSARYPANRDYILRHNPLAWESLAQLADIAPVERRHRLLHAIRNRS